MPVTVNNKTIIFFLMAGLGTLYWVSSKKRPKEHTKANLSLLLWESARNIQKVYEIGDIAKEMPIGPNTHRDFYRCNGHFLEFFLSGKLKKKPRFSYTIDEKKVEVTAVPLGNTHRFSKVVTRSNHPGKLTPPYALQIHLVFKKISHPGLFFFLEDTCRETYLPQRKYRAGEIKGEKIWHFDTMDRHIFIDKYYVSNYDVFEWINSTNLKNSHFEKKVNDKKNWGRPATFLSLKERKDYCSFKGKHLLQSHYFDAATFYPPDKKNILPPRYLPGPYPWSAQKAALDLSSQKEICRKVFAKECRDKSPYQDFSPSSPSWIGIYNSLGGHLEGLDNTHTPSNNLKASSMVFPLNSMWHKLGLRAYWPGLTSSIVWSTSKSAFSGGKSESPPQASSFYPVAFRCMRVVL